jgi:hypothetical protein
MNIRRRRRNSSLQFSPDEELLRRNVIFNLQNVGLAADLTIFNVALAAAGTRVHRGEVPLTATCALKASFHTGKIISHCPG